MDQSTLWLQYLNALSSAVNLSAGEALQVTYPYVVWNWGGQNPILGSYAYEQWATLDVVPSDPQLNTKTDAAASQSGFDVAYQNWFNTLAIGNLAQDQHYQDLQANMTAAQNQYTRDYGNIKNAWMTQTGGTGPSLTAWLADPAQFGYQTTISEDQSNVLAAQKQLDTYRAQITQPLAQITADYANAKYQGYVTDPSSSASLQVRLWDTQPYPNPWAYIQQVVGTFGKDAQNGNKATFSFSQNTDSYSYSEYYSEGGAGAWDDFIGFEVGGSFQQIEWQEFSTDYNLTFSFQDLQAVTVRPEGWFEGANIASFAKGPYATGFSEYASGNNNYFFGPGGALSRIYTAMIIGYRPTVTISAGQAFSSYLQQKWEAEGGLEIGPFFFGAKTSGENTSSTSNLTSSGLELQSTASWPVIVGMKSAWTQPPSGQPSAAAAALGERRAASALAPAGGAFTSEAELQRAGLGAVQNLAPGAIMNVAAGQIAGSAHMYRTGQGLATPGNVGWAPNIGPLQQQAINVGQTVTFAINGAAGMLANGAPSMVQVLWV